MTISLSAHGWDLLRHANKRGGAPSDLDHIGYLFMYSSGLVEWLSPTTVETTYAGQVFLLTLEPPR